MADRETVITHLQIIQTWAAFARERDLNFFTRKHLEDIAQWADDALALLKEQQEIVRCKDCIYRGNPRKCIVANIAEKQDMPYFVYDNRGEWFCADGKRKEG